MSVTRTSSHLLATHADMPAWLIVGIAGGTCSGKSTLARAIAERLEQRRTTDDDDDQQTDDAPRQPQQFGVVRIIKQDDYFHRRDRPEHTWIPGWNYINREIMTALDMSRMCADIEQTLATVCSPQRLNILLIEGFLIFNHATVRPMCQLRFDVRITYEECRRRRQTRTYNPPNPPRYFDEFLWPYYQKHLAEYAADRELIVLDGQLSEVELLNVALDRIDYYCREIITK